MRRCGDGKKEGKINKESVEGRGEDTGELRKGRRRETNKVWKWKLKNGRIEKKIKRE